MAHCSPPRAALLFLSLLACAVLPGAALAKDADSNAQGFKAYEKGDYKKAHALFEKALKQNPSNAYARLNRARTRTLLNKGKEGASGFDYCEFASNWILLALADLSVAVEQNPALLAKIDEDSKGLKALKERGEYSVWRKAAAIAAGEPGAVEKVLGSTHDWLVTSPGTMPRSLTLRPDKKLAEEDHTGESRIVGQWSPKGDGVELTPANQGKAALWKPSAGKYYFDEGKHFFFELHLAPAAGPSPETSWLEGTVKVGPLGQDCE